MAERRRLVVKLAEIRAQWHFVDCLGELEVRRRCVHRVAAQNQQEADRTCVHVADEFSQPCPLIHRVRLNCLRVHDSVADVTQSVVHCVGQRVHGGRLSLAGDDEAPATRVLKILGEGPDPRLS
jgi:hypothetical protein